VASRFGGEFGREPRRKQGEGPNRPAVLDAAPSEVSNWTWTAGAPVQRWLAMLETMPDYVNGREETKIFGGGQQTGRRRREEVGGDGAMK